MAAIFSSFIVPVTVAFSVLLSTFTANAQQTSETVATAAKKAFTEGAKQLADGNHTGAITLLKSAVRMHPENGEYHHKLAKAFVAAKKYHETWVHLRKAAVLELSNKTYAQDFMRLWQYHDLQGTLNVGSTDEAILKSMGEPDKRIEDGTMKRWAYGFMAIDFGTKNNGQSGVNRVLDLRGYTAEAAQEVEQVSVKTDPTKWKIAHHQVSRTNDNLELTLKDEKIQQWSELFSKQRFPLMSQSKATVSGMLGSLQSSLKATNPNIKFTIISQSQVEAHYHWVSPGNEANPAQHEVAKIIKGKKDFYRVAYVKKTDALSDEELKKWSGIIGAAKLVPLSAESKTATGETEATSNGNASANTTVQAWELGQSLSFAAILRGRHAPDETVKSTLLTVSKNAQALDVTVPRPEKLSGDASADTAAAISFLLETAGKPLYSSLEEKHGSKHAALFELATKSSLLMVLYQPEDSTSKSFAAAIETAAKKATLETDVWKPLVDKIRNGDTKEIVGKEIKRFQSQVATTIK